MSSRRIDFQVNYSKALEAVLYVLKQRRAVDLYATLKIIFEADKIHLNEHGRPVTGDRYIKMEYGTVPSFIYDMFKNDPLGLSALNIDKYPFRQVGHRLVAERAPDLDQLSESDIEALDRGIQKYVDLD